MTTVREKGFLLLLLLHTAYPEEHPGVPVPIFRAQGSVIEMGYCFGVDYIAVFRSAPDGDQLLGNSSYEATPPSLPGDLEGRVSITNQGQLLGFQITRLRHSDTGLYRRECWQDNELANQHEHELSVCNEEHSNQKITLMEDGGAELLCNSSSIRGSVRATIRWYHDVFPEDKTTLFVDSSVSLEPLQEELRGVVEVRDGGALLRVPASVLKRSHFTFYCLVMDGQRCLSFQNIDQPDSEEAETVFVSEGEKVVLTCPSKYSSHEQRWETPLGLVNSTVQSSTGHMYTVPGGESGNYSLVIHVLSANYSGDYFCYSPFLITEYSLVVCPRREPTGILFSDGEEAVLKCGPTQDESHSVRWYRRRGREKGHLIMDSEDRLIALPEDLKGRVDLSVQDSSLRLSDLKPGDSGEYWCVLWSTDFLEEDDYLDGNVDEEYPEGEEEHKDYTWAEDYMDRCIFKQVTHLTLKASEKEGRGITPRSPGHHPESNTTPGPTTNSTVYAVCAVLGGLVVVGAIAAVVAIRRKNRMRASRTQGGAVMGYSGVETEEKELKEAVGSGQDENTA